MSPETVDEPPEPTTRASTILGERPCLIERKLIVARAVRVGPEETDQRELFRHDRVWDFFIVAAFRSESRSPA